MENKKKEKTKIDIILPNFNSSEFISETVKSILNQLNTLSLEKNFKVQILYFRDQVVQATQQKIG